jgi:hypothetical protein
MKISRINRGKNAAARIMVNHSRLPCSASQVPEVERRNRKMPLFLRKIAPIFAEAIYPPFMSGG